MFWLLFPFSQPPYIHSFLIFARVCTSCCCSVCFLCQQHKAAHIVNSWPIPIPISIPVFMLRNAIQDNSCTNLACMLHCRTKLLWAFISASRSVWGWGLICPAGPLFSRQFSETMKRKAEKFTISLSTMGGAPGVCVMAEICSEPLFSYVFRKIFIIAASLLGAILLE